MRGGRARLGVREVARVLRLTPRRLAELSASGRIPGVCVRGRWRYRAGDILRFVLSGGAWPEHGRHGTTTVG